MKVNRKAFWRVACLLLCFCCVLASAPLARSEGLLQLIIDDNTYNRVVLDAGSLELYNWKFDAGEDTLTLKNFGTASSPKGRIFACPYGGYLTVNLIGDNYIRLDRDTPLLVVGHIIFTGTGRLTIYSPDSYCISTDYSVSVTESASLCLDGNAGIMAIQGFTVDTTGSVIIEANRKAVMASEGVEVVGGTVNLRGTNGFFTSRGNVLLQGGDTDVEITASSSAIFMSNQENYVEWSANGVVTAGDSAPGSAITTYNNETYFHASFSGIPKLNVPRRIYWDETVFSDSDSNPVGRWTKVENAIGYEVKLYYYNQNTHVNSLMETVTVTDGLSCNFDKLFTTYGLYYFSVRALGDNINFLSSNESAKSANGYLFTGEIASRYYVSLPTSPYYTVRPVNDSDVVYYGDDYSFTIDVDPAYSQSELIVRCNGVRVALRHGLYTIDDVSSNLVITVDDPTLNTYKITIPTDEAFVIRPLLGYSADEVEHGGKFLFSFDTAELYREKSNPVVYANGVELDEPMYGIIYTIENITEDQTITVSGMIRDNYDVTFCETDGTVLTTVNVNHGYPVSQPTDPSAPSGTTFRGWYNKDGTPYDFSTPVTDYKTVYARYEAPKDTDGTYLISSLSQLIWFGKEVRFGNTNLNGKLTADISMNSGKYVKVGDDTVFATDAEIWKPIGGYDYLASDDDYVRFYGGTFDGNGHTLSGFYVSYDAMDANASYLGIFGITASTAQIKNLSVSNSFFDGYSYIGSVVGKNEGVIQNCTGFANCNGILNIGGIAGSTSNLVANCTNNGTVTVEQYTSDASAAPIGGNNGGGVVGLIDASDATVFNCQNNGAVYAYDCAGGIVGVGTQSGCLMSGCVNRGAVTSKTYAGGIGAKLNADYTDCRNYGDVLADISVGGIASVAAPCTLTHCCNEGDVITTTGIASGFLTTVTSSGLCSFRFCYNAGTVSAKTSAGGFSVEAPNVSFYQCHSFGYVYAPNNNAYVVQATEKTATETYYVQEKLKLSSCGEPISEARFCSGWLAYDMNRSCGQGCWAYGDGYPIFADDATPAFVPSFCGEGTAESPYLIRNEHDLRMLADFVNLESMFSDACLLQTNDISLSHPASADNFSPIGTADTPFVGLYDGDNHTIAAVHIQSNGNYVGLFGYADGAVLLNICLKDSSVKGVDFVGGLVGYGKDCYCSSFQAENVSVNGNIKVGGLIGDLIGDVMDSTASATVNGVFCVGGLVGIIESGSACNCFSNGCVTAVSSVSQNAEEIGGLVGSNFAAIECCGSTCSVVGESAVGGFIGSNYGIVSSCYASGLASAQSKFGGFIGEEQGVEESVNCYYSNCNSGTQVGTPQEDYWFLSGVTAYYLNRNGADLIWTQGTYGPVLAFDEADAIRHTVRFVSFNEEYYFSGAKNGQAPVVIPQNPTVDGFEFLRWDKSLDAVTENITVYAVFEQGSLITLLPNSGLKILKIDNECILTGLNPNAPITVEQLRSQIANKNIAITDEYGSEITDTSTAVTSGLLIQLYSQPGIYDDFVTVVIFGDLDNNGAVDDMDAFLLNLILSETISTSDLGVAAVFAADIDGNGQIEQNDFTVMQKYLLKEAAIQQLR